MESQLIQYKIYEHREQRMMPAYVAEEIWQIETKNFGYSVRCTMSRFPPDFIVQLIKERWKTLRCQDCPSFVCF